MVGLWFYFLKAEAMAKFKHEITNRKVLARKESIQYDWKEITCIYPKKCDVCQAWIEKHSKVLWNVNTKHVMHIDCI
jgi:hypothetical protein